MIPFLDVKSINSRFETAYQEVFTSFLSSGTYILGEQLKQFEKHYAAYCGTEYCLGVGNGLDAITLIFKGYLALGKLKKGDEVLVPANTYVASILAIMQAGLQPVLVDADSNTFNICISDLKEKLSSRTKAILVVHLYGRLVEMDVVNELAKSNNLLVIEDAAQAHGVATGSGKKAGALSDAAAFSFYPTKNLGALGDGGAVTTNDTALFEIVNKLRNYGGSIKYKYDYIGVNSRLDELQAALLSIKLPYLDIDNKQRKAIADCYLKGITNSMIQLPKADDTHVFYAFVIRCKERDKLQQFLLERGVQTVIHYPIPPHKQEALTTFKNEKLPVTELLHQEVLSLPISPVQTIETTQQIIDIINQF